MMMTLSIIYALAMAMTLAACSGSGQEKKETISKTIDRQTTQAAERIEKKIRTPLQKARDTRHLGEQRTDAIDRAVSGQ